jgi:hypothetical protein
MELKATNQDVGSAQDEQQWELADEELDRAAESSARGPICSTSRPCSCSRCMCR